MADTMRWVAGERPTTSGVGNEGAVGGDGTGWTRETTIIAPGGKSLASYGRNLNSAAATSTLSPYSATAGDIALNASKIAFTFWLHCTDWTPADFVIFATIIPATGTPAYTSIALQTSGKMAVVKGSDGTVGAETNAIFTDNAAAYFRVTVEWNGTTSYRWRLWVWGSGGTVSGNAFDSSGWGAALIDFTETNVAITGGINRIIYRATGSPKGVAPNTQVYLDDMTLRTFSADADLPTAPESVFASSPNATGTDSAFTTTQAGAGTGPNSADVDETDYNGDTDYNSNPLTTAVEENQTYNLASIPALAAGERISGVSWYATAKSTSVSATVCRMRGYIGGTLENPALNWSVSTANYQTAHHCLALSPATGVGITEAEANGMECGIRKSAVASRTVRLTSTFANVAIVPAVATRRIFIT